MVDAFTQAENQTSWKWNCCQSEAAGTETKDTEKDEVADTGTEWERTFNTSQTESTIPDESTPVNSNIFCFIWLLFIHYVNACSYICKCNL